MSDAAPWQRLSPRARRAILLTSFVPPVVLILVFTPAYLIYVGDPTDVNLALVLAAIVLLLGTILGLSVRLLLILGHEPTPPAHEPAGRAWLAEYLVSLAVFGPLYLLAIYATVFYPWGETTEDRIVANGVLLVVLVSIPILFYGAARRFEKWIRRRQASG